MRFISMFALSACLLFSGCDRGPRVSRAAYEDTVRLDRENYEKQVRGLLKDLDYRFDGLEERAKGLDPAGRDKLRRDVAELRDRKAVIEKKFDDLRKVSDESWLDVKTSLDRDIDQLEIAYNLVAANNRR